jgi:hypothetical protein
MKIILLIFSMFVMYVVQAQTFRQTTSNPNGAILNTSSDTMTYRLSRSFHIVSIQPVITKATGTMAGTAILQLSVNGTNYVSTDTLTLTNVTTNSIVWNKLTAANYLRIIVGGATTVTGTASAKVSASP